MGPQIDFEAVFKACQAPSVLLTPDFVMVAANDAYVQLADRSLEELLGRNLFAVFPANPHPPDAPEVQGADILRDSLEQAVVTGKPNAMPLQRYDVEAPGKPGTFEERYWNTVNTPVLGPDGAVEWIILSTEEITDFVQALRRRPHARGKPDADLVTRVSELHHLSEQLKQVHKQHRETTMALRKAIEEQRKLVFDTSHDLRNPITGLLTELEVALSEPDIEFGQQILRKLLRDAERLNDIVADMLDLARLDSVTPAVTEPVDLARLVEEELQRHVPAAVVVTRLGRGVVVHASWIRLARLLNNLLANAERHTSTTIEISVVAEPPDAVLEVIDDGPGVPPADRERIFERLCRLEEARRRDPGGSGLGLPIAREIAQTYGGRLLCADHSPGARFVLRLPLAAQLTGPPPA